MSDRCAAHRDLLPTPRFDVTLDDSGSIHVEPSLHGEGDGVRELGRLLPEGVAPGRKAPSPPNSITTPQPPPPTKIHRRFHAPCHLLHRHPHQFRGLRGG